MHCIRRKRRQRRPETSPDAWRSPEREGAEMLVVAPLLCLPLIALALRAWRGAMGWRETLLAASALWGAYLTAVCELLSAAHALTAQWLTAAWAPLLLA